MNVYADNVMFYNIVVMFKELQQIPYKYSFQ